MSNTFTEDELIVIRHALERYYYLCREDSEFQDYIPTVLSAEKKLNMIIRDLNTNQEA